MQPTAVIGPRRRDAHLCLCVPRKVKAELKQMRPALFYTFLLSVLLIILPDPNVHSCYWDANLHICFFCHLLTQIATQLLTLLHALSAATATDHKLHRVECNSWGTGCLFCHPLI